jgi:hypothetical protein
MTNIAVPPKDESRGIVFPRLSNKKTVGTIDLPTAFGFSLCFSSAPAEWADHEREVVKIEVKPAPKHLHHGPHSLDDLFLRHETENVNREIRPEFSDQHGKFVKPCFLPACLPSFP